VISPVPSNFANAVAPYAPLGRQPVSQENSDLKSSTFRPAEQLAESGRGENRRTPDERPNDEVEQDRLISSRRDQPEDRDQVKREREQAELKQVQELAARDREVRAHEQAHAAAAGQYGSSPTYEYVRGPDGVSYAVGGSVEVDTSPIPNNPEATLRKAEQLQRAASAPADPSGQDRQVAAQAAQLAEQARAEIREQAAIEAREIERQQRETDEERRAQEAGREEERLAAEAARKEREDASFSDEQRLLDQRRARAELFDQAGRRNIDINRRLIEIGVFPGAISTGRFLDKTV
jgi:hypothetical protein